MSRFHAFDLLATLVAVVNSQGAVLFANAALEDALGISRRAIVGSHFPDSFTETLPLLHALQGAGGNEFAALRYDAVLRRMSREDLPVHVIVTQTEKPEEIIVELLPLEQQARQDREQRLAEQAQTNKELIRNLAHEIKNPLGGIRGAAQLLERQLDSAELREYTAVIIHEADRLRALADRMLGARQPPAFARVNIHQILERVRRILQAEAGDAVQLVRDYDPSLPEVWADPDQLIQVFLNIMGNAVQCLLEMPPNQAADRLPPRVLIRSRVLRRFTIGTRCHALLCQVEIEDNGPGISTELRETVFYPMVTGRSQGTGLGLPIAQAIMQQHGGLIECESQPGQTIFKVLVPFPPTNDGTAPGDSHAQP